MYVLSPLSEIAEAESFTCDAGNREVGSHKETITENEAADCDLSLFLAKSPKNLHRRD